MVENVVAITIPLYLFEFLVFGLLGEWVLVIHGQDK